MKLLITGTRRATIADHGLIIRDAILNALGNGGDLPHKIYVGDNDGTKDSDGVDFIAEQLTRRHGWVPHVFEARWEECAANCPTGHRRRRPGSRDEYCPLAGPRRNRRMVAAFAAAGGKVVLAFPAANTRSTGTTGCIREAKRAGLDVPPQHIIPLTVEVDAR